MTTSPAKSFASHWLPWALLVVVLGVALAVGAQSNQKSTLTERTRSVAETIRCPECTDKSMAASDAPTSVAGRKEIRRQLAQGRTADEIRAWFSDRYGQDILLTPSRRGIEGLIWAIPVVAFVIAAAVLAAAFLRWNRRESQGPSDEDRATVDAALAARHNPVAAAKVPVESDATVPDVDQGDGAEDASS